MPNSGAKYVVAAADYLPGGLMSVGIASLAGLLPLLLFRRRRGTGATAALAACALVAFLVATALPLKLLCCLTRPTLRAPVNGLKPTKTKAGLK